MNETEACREGSANPGLETEALRKQLEEIRATAEQHRKHRELREQMLEIWSAESIVPKLEDALSWLSDATSSDVVYVAVYGAERKLDAPTWWLAPGVSGGEVEDLRGTSSGIIETALKYNETIMTAAAVEDPRFSMRQSVVTNRIRAVLCMPLGRPGYGCVYLERSVPFMDEDQDLVFAFRQELERLASQLMRGNPPGHDGPGTREPPKGLKMDGFVGRSRAILEALYTADLAAKSRGEYAVLITGESGTGKTEIAHLIHKNSVRADKRFAAINCAAIPEHLAESELFGHRRGAFTGATSNRDGLIKTTDGGTLFLDEIGDLPPAVQVKLLKFLQDGRFRPVGSDHDEQADVRIISATNRDLEGMVQRDEFRQALFHRIRGDVLHMPALRERPEDIELLARHFLERYAERSGYAALPVMPAALEACRKHTWPGNLHQLKNTVERALDRAVRDGARTLEPEYFFSDISSDELNRPDKDNYDDAVAQFSRHLFMSVLRETGGNHSLAMERMGLQRSRYYRMIDRFQVDGTPFRAPDEPKRGRPRGSKDKTKRRKG